jgi:hypothetical protein
VVYLAPDCITSGILFNQLQICPGLNIFSDFRDLSTPFIALGCYIDFSSFSASRVICAQEFFLNTTCVTVDTFGASSQDEQSAG